MVLPELSFIISLWNSLRDTLWWKDETSDEEQISEENLKLISELREQVESQRSRIQSQRAQLHQKEEEVDDYERIIRSLGDDNILVEDLVEEYWRESTILIVSISKQENSHGEKESFIREKLNEKYDLIKLTSKTWVIPPAHFPSELDARSNRNEIKNWLVEEVYSDVDGYQGLVPFITAVDLKNVYSRNDFEDDEINDPANCLEEELGLTRLMTEEDFSDELASNNISLMEVIESGHVTFFISSYVADETLEDISRDIDEITRELEDKLDTVSLYMLADNDAVEPLAEVLDDYIPNSRKVARGAVGVAKMWEQRIQTTESDATKEPTEDSPPMMEAS